MDALSKVCQDLLQKISTGEIADVRELAKGKIRACREFGLPRPPSNSELLASATVDEKNKVLQLLRLKPVRSISGVSVITEMPRPKGRTMHLLP